MQDTKIAGTPIPRIHMKLNGNFDFWLFIGLRMLEFHAAMLRVTKHMNS